MLTTSDHALPCAASPEGGYTALAMAVLAQAVHDLEEGTPQVRAHARYDVSAGGLDWALAWLSPGAQQRVRALLEELAG